MVPFLTCCAVVSLLFQASLSVSAVTVTVRSDGCGNESLDCCSNGGSDWTCPSLHSAIARSNILASGVELVLPPSPSSYPLAANSSNLIGLASFTMRGEAGSPAVIQCEGDTGLAFYNSSALTFTNLRFVGCGAVRNSTSRDFARDNKDNFLLLRATLYFLFCSEVTIRNVQVNESTGTGVVLYSTVGTNVIVDSVFASNRPTTQRGGGGGGGGGGMTIEFVFCIPGDFQCFQQSTSSSPAIYSTGASYLIQNCSFVDNEAAILGYNVNAFTSSFQSYFVGLGRGGGLSVFFKGTAHDIPVTILDCRFERNAAVWGGGLLVEYEDSSQNNSVEVLSSVFNENRCQYHPLNYNGTGGGGIRVAYAGLSNQVRNNSFIATSTVFTGNRAYFGGGTSIFVFPEAGVSLPTNTIDFVNCSWTGNIARLGSAIDLTSYQETVSSSITRSTFNNSRFDSNTIMYTSLTGVAAGEGTVYADTVPLLIRGSFNSRNNFGSGVVSVNAKLEFTEYSSAIFTNNTAQNGGGISLYSSAYILLSESTSLVFTKNRAHFRGGGLFWQSVGNHELISAGNCIIRYKDSITSPYNWPVRIQFTNNTADIAGSAIYVTTLLTCLWGGRSFGALGNINVEFSNVFCWNSRPVLTWDYGSDTCNNSIATAPGSFINTGRGQPYLSSIFPGQVLQLPVRMEDDWNHYVPESSLVFSLMSEKDHEDYVSREVQVPVEDQATNSVAITLNTLQPRVLTTEIIVNVTGCPTGYIFNYTTLVCSPGEYRFFRTSLNFTSFIQRGYWIGYNINRTELIAAQCFHCGYNPELPLTDYTPLPMEIEELDDFFCGAINRTGVTCSRCREGTGPAINSKFYPCVDCPPNVEYYSWVLFLLTEFAPNTILLLCVVIFNISVTSGPANAFIFFAQVISTTFGVDANGVIPFSSITPAARSIRQAYTAIYDIWNLNFFDAVEGWQFCLSPNLNALHLSLFGYIAALYPIILLFLFLFVAVLYDRQYQCVARCIRPLHRVFVRVRHRWNFQRSITDAFATFIVLSFSKVAVNSQNILFANTVYDANGTEITTIALLYGEYDTSSREYLVFFIPALFVFIFMCIVLPLVLLLYSIKPFYSCLNKLKLKFLLPGEKFQHFLNAFHYCYKDSTNNTHDLRFFAALYFILRVLLIWTYGLAPTWTQQYVMQQIILTVGVLLFGVLQPYKNPFYNFLDSAFFSLLATINILTMFNRYREAADLPLSARAYWIEIVLIFSPLVYLVGYLLYYCFKAYNVTVKRVMRKLCYRTEEVEYGRSVHVARFKRLTHLRTATNDSFTNFINDTDYDGETQRTTSYYGPPTDYTDADLPEPTRGIGHSSFSLDKNEDKSSNND